MSGSSRGGSTAVALLKGHSKVCSQCSRFVRAGWPSTPIPFRYRSYSGATTRNPSTENASPVEIPAQPSKASSRLFPPTTSSSRAPKRMSSKEMGPVGSHVLRGGIILTRAPLLTRQLTSFEEAFFFYQKRLNERLTLPFMPGLYFKEDTAAKMDWEIKHKRRKMVASKEIGHYQKRGREAWNDELLVGDKMSTTQHLYDTLLEDAMPLVTDEGDIIKEEDLVPVERPQQRKGEADLINDTTRLDRKMDQTLYLVIQDGNGVWKFPDDVIEYKEGIHDTAARALREQCGKDMNTWMVGRHPVAHYIVPPVMKRGNPREVAKSGEKVFYVKGRIMAGQANISSSRTTHGIKDFQWLTRDELPPLLGYERFSKLRIMMADR